MNKRYKSTQREAVFFHVRFVGGFFFFVFMCHIMVAANGNSEIPQILVYATNVR